MNENIHLVFKKQLMNIVLSSAINQNETAHLLCNLKSLIKAASTSKALIFDEKGKSLKTLCYINLFG